MTIAEQIKVLCVRKSYRLLMPWLLGVCEKTDWNGCTM